MRNTFKVLLAVAAGAFLAGAAASCGSSGNATSGAGTCVPGAQQSCACVGNVQGIQTCSSDGKSLGMCQCSAGTGGASSSSSGIMTGAGGGSCQCAISTPTEGMAPYCGAKACANMSSSSSASSSSTSGSSSSSGTASTSSSSSSGTVSTSSSSSSSGCATMPTYAGMAPSTLTTTSNWSYSGMVGLQAGNQACMDMGADHVCDYDDVLYAASQGEFAGLATTTKAWLQRTHTVTATATGPLFVTSDGTCGDVTMGAPKACGAAAVGTTFVASKGSRCFDWNYSTDHLNDGEWIDFSTGTSTPTFHLDNDPCHIQSPNPGKDSACGHGSMITRAVLCCYAKNACNPAVAAGPECPCAAGCKNM